MKMKQMIRAVADALNSYAAKHGLIGLSILDKTLEFDPAGTAITATAPSTNVLDMLQARDIGAGYEGMPALTVAVFVQQTFAAAGAATLNIQIQGSTDNATWFTMAESGAIPKGQLTVNSKWDVVMPNQAPGQPVPRYFRLNYVVATGPFTAGTVQAEMAGVTEEIPQGPTGLNSGYASGFTVNN